MGFARITCLAFMLASVARCAINWSSECNEFNSSAISFQCANLTVPLDYTADNSSEKLSLQLLKIPAEFESKGSILFNFGGPGQLARQDLSKLGVNLIPLTGGHYDLIAFDTRGTANTIPFECTDDPIEAYQMNTEQVVGNSSDTAVGKLWARGAIDASICSSYKKQMGSYISTAFVARDLISVVDALEEDGMLRYWGLSYGTTLGATVAAMFPERIDKIVLDAVQNPHEYYHAYADAESWTDSDKVFSAIFSTCVEAGPERCPLAAHNLTGEQLEAATWDFLYKVKYHPVATGSSVLDYTAVKALIGQAMYSTRHWQSLAIQLDTLMFGVKHEESSSSEGGGSTGSSDEDAADAGLRTAGIHCVDNMARASDFETVAPTIEQLFKTSKVSGELNMGTYMRCNQWTIEPKEVYKGSFDVQTKNPALFIGNTHDGHTPLKSARNVSETFEGSALLQVDGYGHGSLSLPSKCTLGKVTSYWLNGSLPAQGTVCEVDIKPYSEGWWPEVFKSAGVPDRLIKTVPAT